MSVMFNLTIAGPELFDSVIFMDNSPALAAFEEEVGKIISDLNKSGRFGNAGEIDVDKLIASSSDTLLHMQRAYLIWSFHEEYGKKSSAENTFIKVMKLFFKSQESTLIELNGGKKLIDVSDISAFKKKYIDKISSDAAVFKSVKEFFAGYVYGFFFSYLDEQTIMKDYAEMLVCLGMISGAINSTATQKQKIMPAMAMLLNSDRFKYISGEIPINIMLDIICERFDFTGITDSEKTNLTDALKEYVISNYEHESHDEDCLISDIAVTDVMEKLNSKYINSAEFANEIFCNSFKGTRTFLDADKEDMGEFTTEKISSVMADKCSKNFNSFYCSGKEGEINVSLGADYIGYKYPLVYKDGSTFCFADIYKEILFPALDSSIYVSVKPEELPLKDYPFTDATLGTNIIRVLGGLKTKGFSVRADKKSLLGEIKLLSESKTMSEDERRMLTLEKTLSLVSGNMESGTYQRLVDDCIFGTSLYEEYIRYRMDCMFSQGMKDISAKKKLLDELNTIK